LRRTRRRRLPKTPVEIGRARAWMTDARGVSAIEFSLVAPALIVVFMGLADLATATMAQLHVNHAAQGTADAVASEQALTQSDMANMLTAASYFMTPYSGAPLSVRITNIYYDGVPSHAYGLVYWSCALNGSSSKTSYTPYTYKQQFNYIPGMTQQSSTAIYWVLWTGNSASIGTSVIVVETSYSFSSPSNYIIKNTPVMTSAYVTVPRVANYVGFPYSATTTLKAPQSTTTANSVTLSDGATCNYGS
jgi:Flp pilus assembly protein TadG